MARILVVDDEVAVREMLRMLLRKAGHEVVEAGDGHRAVQLQSQQPFDLMITDIHMPEKDGLSTIMDLHRSYPSLRIIAMTGGSIRDYLKWARKLGAHRAMIKPFSMEELLGNVRELLAQESPPRIEDPEAT